MLLNTILSVLIVELWLVWFAWFHCEAVWNVIYNIQFHFSVFCAWVSFLCFAKSSVITETKADGEIVRQVYIGGE